MSLYRCMSGGGTSAGFEVIDFQTNASSGATNTYSYTVSNEDAQKYKGFLFVTRSQSGGNNANVTVNTNTLNAVAIYQVNNATYQKSVYYADNATAGAEFNVSMRYNSHVFVVIGIL